MSQAGVVASALLAVGIVDGLTLGASRLTVTRPTVGIPGLPAPLDGFTIAHLSDLHVDNLGAAATPLWRKIEAAVETAQPDLIVFTGDYGETDMLERLGEPLGRLRATRGKFAVLGNHDFGPRERAGDNWSSPEDKQRKVDRLAANWRRLGFELLLNHSHTIDVSGAQLLVIGVGAFDPHHGFDDADLNLAMGDAPASAVCVLLAHNPDYWRTVLTTPREIALTLAGHTHGAQFGFGLGRFVWTPASLYFERALGLYREGSRSLYVNRGVGTFGLPFRFNMSPEVAIVTLRPEAG